MENEFHEQLFGSIGGISFSQASASDAGSQDQEPKLLQCPNCEIETLAAKYCIYCGFGLVDWALSMTQSNAIAETLNEMRNGGMYND